MPDESRRGRRQRKPIAMRGTKPVPGILSPVPPPTDEIKAVTKLFADEIKHSVVIAASSPLTEHFPKDSYASIMQDYLKKNTPKQTEIAIKARAFLTAPLAKQKMYFGRYAQMDASALKRRTPDAEAELDSAMTRAFESALKTKELYDKFGVLGKYKREAILKTRLKIDLSSGEFQGNFRTNYEFNQPEHLSFKWETSEPEATSGQWEMKFLDKPENEAKKGSAGTIPPGKFTIDFHEYFAATPPPEPQTVLVRIQPMKISAPPTTPTPHGATYRKSVPVGEPSNWVSITYIKAGAQTEFNLLPEDTGHYQHIEFFINRITCVKETGEWSGSDEILLAGFHNLSDGRIIKQGTWTVGSFDQGTTLPIPSNRPIRWTSFKLFPMQFPTGNLLGQEPVDNYLVAWPKAYAFTLILIEKDEGGTEEIVANVIIKVLDWINNWIEEAAGGIASSYLGDEAGAIVGSIVGGIVGELFGLFQELLDNCDDLIAQQTYTLWLESSKVSFIHNLPGYVNDLGNALGLNTPQTEFVSNPQVLRFEGGDESSGGIYDIEVFWKANYRYFNY